MVILNTQGIVLKSVTYKENDLILTIYTRKLGKIAAIARGAKKVKVLYYLHRKYLHTLTLH